MMIKMIGLVSDRDSSSTGWRSSGNFIPEMRTAERAVVVDFQIGIPV